MNAEMDSEFKRLRKRKHSEKKKATHFYSLKASLKRASMVYLVNMSQLIT